MATLRNAGTQLTSRPVNVAFAHDGTTTFDTNVTVMTSTSRLLCSGSSDHRPGLFMEALSCAFFMLLLSRTAMRALIPMLLAGFCVRFLIRPENRPAPCCTASVHYP